MAFQHLFLGHPLGGDDNPHHHHQAGRRQEGQEQHQRKEQDLDHHSKDFLAAEEKGAKSCINSMHMRMPGSISLAPQGGTCPIVEISKPEIKVTPFTSKGEEPAIKESRLRQPILRWPTERTEKEEQAMGQRMPKEQERQEKARYVKGGTKEDNQRYKEFLEYCEEKRT